MTQQPYDRNASHSRYKAQKRREEARSRRVLVIAVVAAAVAVAFLLAVSAGGRGADDLSSQPSRTGAAAAPAARDLSEPEGAEDAREPYELDRQDILAIPGSDVVTAFDLRAPLVQQPYRGKASEAISTALAAVLDNGMCGFVFIDVDTGEGLAYNVEEENYLASSSKAVLSYHVMLNGGPAGDYERTMMERAIIYSDNSAYNALGYIYSDADYAEWLVPYGINEVDYRADYYLHASARSLASIWADLRGWLVEGSPDAEWFGGLLASTTTSFIRDGVADTGATVMNKAGWIAEWNLNSLTDSALIQADGHTYLMTIVTGQPDWDANRAAFSDLARALFSARNDLL